MAILRDHDYSVRKDKDTEPHLNIPWMDSWRHILSVYMAATFYLSCALAGGARQSGWEI